MDNKERGREARRGEEKGQGACGGERHSELCTLKYFKDVFIPLKQ